MSGRRAILSVAFAAVGSGAIAAGGGRESITSADLREWLTYIASDELEGRAVYSEGFGLAAGYIQSHLQEWGVEPRGDGGSYLQTVRVAGRQSHEPFDADGAGRRGSPHLQGRRRDHVSEVRRREAHASPSTGSSSRPTVSTRRATTTRISPVKTFAAPRWCFSAPPRRRRLTSTRDAGSSPDGAAG